MSARHTHELDDRSREVLKTLIQLHIATGQPVGSESLARSMKRSFSPATLRNTMAEMERAGLLDHPHTSAGRIPTDEGYRAYVDGMLTRRPLPKRDAEAIESTLHGDGTASGLMESASHLLSQLSRNVGFVVGPELAGTAFRHIDLIRLAPLRILVVMVTRTGIVTNRVIEIDEEVTPDELQACANYLNAHFAGLTLSKIRAQLLKLMSEEKALYDTLLKRVVTLGEQVFEPPAGAAEVYLDGTTNIIAQREFEDVERMRSLFRTFEQKSRLVAILTACITGDGVRIVIGREHPDPDWHGLSVVAAGSGAESGALFGLGVMGSTRMEYARMISVVDHVARAFSESLKELLT